MKKFLILPALFILMQTALCIAFPQANNNKINRDKQDSLAVYTGKYQMQQGMQTIYSELYVENGKLTAKSTDGEILTLDHLSGDDFIVSKQGLAIKFIRNGANQVSQIAVMGQIQWTKVDTKTPVNVPVKPVFQPADYLGKYQIMMNGQSLFLEISLKDGKLWATQLWDGGNSALDYVSADNFIVNALSIPMKFIRDENKKVTRLLLNGADQFTKVKD